MCKWGVVGLCLRGAEQLSFNLLHASLVGSDSTWGVGGVGVWPWWRLWFVLGPRSWLSFSITFARGTPWGRIIWAVCHALRFVPTLLDAALLRLAHRSLSICCMM